MHFKHPELLYALILLLIPVLVHLFRLRRFRKEKFTNVRVLRKAVQQTRKSSQIKRWVLLFLRMFALASIILAFAQPFYPADEPGLRSSETVIYLDNSYSMQAKGTRGVLLKRAIQELLENLPEGENLSLFTNDREFKAISPQDLRQELQSLEYSNMQLQGNVISIKAEKLFSRRGGQLKNFIAVSDFQEKPGSGDYVPVPEAVNYLVPMQPESRGNIFIDTVFASNQSLDVTELTVVLKEDGEKDPSVPVSLYDGKKLLAKKTIPMEGGIGRTIFKLPAGPISEGRIEIEDPGLDFDNSLYFSINSKHPIKVVAIGSGEMSFLKRIYTKPHFEFESNAENKIDFSSFSTADLVILNEPQRIPGGLAENLKSLLKENKSLVIIPAENASPNDYNPLFSELGIPSFEEKVDQKKLVTEISFSHPLFQEVFEEEVRNFQYPEVSSYFRTGSGYLPILRLDTGEPFLASWEQVFVFTAALSPTNSNFQNSPLIVPVFYNIGHLSLQPVSLYYVLGKPNSMEVPVSLEKEEILHLVSKDYSFIPLQENFADKARIHLDENPISPGQYQLQLDSLSLKTISFNIDRTESHLNYNLPNNENLRVFNSLTHLFESLESRSQIDALWKWFVIFALILLLTEMLILKLIK